MVKHIEYILFVFLCTMFGFSSAAALERRSNSKECSVCHVLWQDEASTNQKTLLRQTDSTIVIAGAKGLSSSKQMCYSCHDGYVADSRNKIGKGNKHHLVGKVPDWLELPETFRLDLNNEFYCGTCHGFHDIGRVGEIGKVPFIRMNNQRSQMCMYCHADKVKQAEYANHPLPEKPMDVSLTSVKKRGAKFGPNGEMICQSCHSPHAKDTMIDSVGDSSLCVLCHAKKKSLINAKHDLRTTLPDEKNIKDQTLLKSGPCGACHTPHKAAGKRLWARKPLPGNPASQMCLSCHGEDTGYETKRIGTHSHPIDVKLKKAVTSKLPLFSGYLQKSSSGRVQCFTCHDVHKWDPSSLTNKGGRDVEGNATNSFLRMSNSASSLCVGCHSDKNQVLTSDHNLNVTAAQEKNIQGFTTAVSGPCGTCHLPHNALSDRLWARRLDVDKDVVTQFCTGCHNKDGPAKEKLIGSNYHPVGVAVEEHTVAMSKADLIKILPLYDEKGEKAGEGNMVCLSCHEPHTWTPSGPGPAVDYKFENIEGTVTNSFLRKANFPSSDLCKICHIVSAYVDATDHDLRITAPDAVNILGQTVEESGPCGSCHLVHNSPNKVKLWGREFGEIEGDQGVMDSLCTGCHSEGGIAENKIPAVATHPKGKLITNIMRYDRKRTEYTPIYDAEDGREVNVGNISCPSCHYASQWNPRLKRKGENRNLEGDGMNSFLRNFSVNLVCIDCHGKETLTRYLYFHLPEKRADIRTQREKAQAP